MGRRRYHVGFVSSDFLNPALLQEPSICCQSHLSGGYLVCKQLHCEWMCCCCYCWCCWCCLCCRCRWCCCCRCCYCCYYCCCCWCCCSCWRCSIYDALIDQTTSCGLMFANMYVSNGKRGGGHLWLRYSCLELLDREPLVWFQQEDELEKLKLRSLSSMRVSDRIVPPSEMVSS